MNDDEEKQLSLQVVEADTRHDRKAIPTETVQQCRSNERFVST